MLVGGVIVDDRVDRLSLGDLRVDLIEEADELLMPMTFHVAADDGAIENVERGEQCGRAVALVVVGHRTGPSRLHRQSRLGAVEGLDLAFFVNREDNGVGGGIDVETDHVPEFFGELRIVRQFECPDTMGRELVGLKDALHRSQADPHGLGQHPTRPLGGLSRRWLGHEVDDLLNRGGGKRRLAGPARLVAQQPVDAFSHEPRLPSPDHRLGFARPAHDLGGAAAVGGGKDDLRAPHMLLRRTAIRHDRLKATAICTRDVDDDSCSHGESLNRFGRFGNRPNESDH